MKDFFQKREFTFELKDLDKEYTLLQISDLHFNEIDDESNLADINDAIETKERWKQQKVIFAKEFGDSYSEEHLIDTTNYFQLFIDLANELKPDAVICTGDMMEKYNDSTARYISKMVKKFEMPFIFAKGNHDTLDKPIYYELTNGDYDYQRIELGKLRIISIDDSHKTISKHCVEEIKKDLDTKQVPILMMHIPILSENNKSDLEKLDPYFFIEDHKCDKDTQDFIDVLKDGSIKLVIVGHLHGHILNELYPGVTMISCSSGLVGCINVIHLVPKR